MQLSLVDMAIHIRDATDRDLPRIIEIERLAFPAPWSLASFQRELTLPFSRIMVGSRRRATSMDGTITTTERLPAFSADG